MRNGCRYVSSLDANSGRKFLSLQDTIVNMLCGDSVSSMVNCGRLTVVPSKYLSRIRHIMI